MMRRQLILAIAAAPLAPAMPARNDAESEILATLRSMEIPVYDHLAASIAELEEMAAIGRAVMRHQITHEQFLDLMGLQK